ncbi:MAG: hypothetical protein IKR09_05960 [Alphaproteobacteria bacterium]|nr:hypothetical protein [Alphaproteobacteria bacterium]
MIGLIVLFSVSVTSSLLWLGGVLFYIYAKIGFPQLLGLPVPDVALLASIAFLPVIFLWMAVGLIYNAMTLRKHGNTVNLLLAQTRRSADHAEVMVRTLMETQVQTRSALVLHNADLFINELNDLLSDIVVRLGLIQPAHTEIVWQRVGDGNRWAFCKVLLQNAENSPKFKDDLQNQLKRDEILSNALRTFCYRFEQMFTMLERHDFEHYLTKIFEEGSLGRVYSRFVEACREVDGRQSAFVRSESVAFEPSPAEEEVSFTAEPEQTDEEQTFDSAAETAPFDDNKTELSEYSERREMSSPFEFLRPTR